MAQDSSRNSFFPQSDFWNVFKTYQRMPFDIQGILETQRKNIQSVAELQQMVFESLQAISYRQTELFSQMMEEQSSLTRELMREGKPEDKIARNAELLQKNYEKTVAGISEISDMIKKSNSETSRVLSKRLSASMKEIKTAINVQQAEKAA